MSTENTREIYRILASSLVKYTYFLLTAAGASIALAMNQTSQLSMNWLQVPLALAVICWGLSFYYGCRCIQCGHSTLHINLDLHRIESGNHPLAGSDPQRMEIGTSTLRKIYEEKSAKVGTHAQNQFALLILGGILYVVWHILEMYARTVN